MLTPTTSSVIPTDVCVVGAGYVGLTAAVGLAELGHRVTCVEVNEQRRAMLHEGRVPIHEPHLEELLIRHLASGQLRVSDSMADAMNTARIALLCVGTPPRPDGEPDLRQLGRAATQVVAAAAEDVLLIVKSTVPPGTCEALELLAAGAARDGTRVVVASNPEFLREGQALWDFFHPDRVVFGVDDPEMRKLLGGLYPTEWPVLWCDRRSAELVKYAANTYLAMKISFANEVAQLSEALGAQSHLVLSGVGLDARIGGAFLNPGPGYGGSCLPKDVAGFVAVAQSVGVSTLLASAVQSVNDGALTHVLHKLEVALGTLSGRRIAVLGIAFKPGTDDVRFSPAIALVASLEQRGASVVAHDPIVTHQAGVDLAGDPYACARGADAVVVMTGWPDYRHLEWDRVASLVAERVVVDAVNIVNLDDAHGAGFDVYGVGRGLSTAFSPVLWAPLEWMLDVESPLPEEVR